MTIPVNQILNMDCLEGMKELPEGSVDMVITSPPYWGLRDYGIPPQVWGGRPGCEHEWGEYAQKTIIGVGHHWQQAENGVGLASGKHQTRYKGDADAAQGGFSERILSFCQLCGAWKGCLGLEPDFNLYIQHLMEIFTEAKRVLKDVGTCWVNLGDTYAGSGNGGSETAGKEVCPPGNKAHIDHNLPAKSLCQIPHRFAIAMSDAGWILRNTIIWHKRNCMPSSVKDRFTVDFEYLFFFSKNNKPLFWTNEKTFEMVTKIPKGIYGAEGVDWGWRECKTCGGVGCEMCMDGYKHYNLWSGHDYYFEQQLEPQSYPGWSKNSQSKCGVPGVAYVNEKRERPHNFKENNDGRNKRAVWTINPKPYPEAHFATFPPELLHTPIKAGCPVGGVVLDPFMGAGTTALTALKLDRKFIGFEISQEYCELANKRIEGWRNQSRLIDFQQTDELSLTEVGV